MSKGRALGLLTTYGRKRVNVAPTGTFLPDGQQTVELAVGRSTDPARTGLKARPHAAGDPSPCALADEFARPQIAEVFDLEDRRV